MNAVFSLAAGSVAGRDHRLAGKNNHDAYFLISEPDLIVAVVCDGCGSGKHSEVGAKIGARLLCESLVRHVRRPGAQTITEATAPVVLERMRRDVLTDLHSLARSMGNSLSAVVNDYFLFTVVGVLITPRRTVLFSLGDGMLAVNGEPILIGPFPDNEPPYLAYDLVESSLAVGESLLGFQVQRSLPTDQVRSFLLGTDGICHLAAAAHRVMPGTTEPVGDIRQFWTQDRYFHNPDSVRRRLEAINREVTQLDTRNIQLQRENGLLPDDTTLIVGRRTEPERMPHEDL